MLTNPHHIQTSCTNDPGHSPADHLADAARHLGQSIAAYNACSAVDDSTAETRTMLHAFHRHLTLMLPHAPVDLLESLIELCAMETARARLEQQADDGTLPGARILDIQG